MTRTIPQLQAQAKIEAKQQRDAARILAELNRILTAASAAEKALV